MTATDDSRRIDALAAGFAADRPDDPWFHVRVGPHATDDGLVTSRGAGVHVRAPGANPRTGEPAFTRSLPPDSVTGLPATHDHAKWLAYTNRRSSAGYPGFDIIPGSALEGAARIGGRTFGTALHPFGAAVADPDADLRLAAFAMTTIDVESWMVFDFLFTNRRVYAFYERLPFGRSEADPYGAFSYAIPVADRTEGDVHEAAIRYDADAGAVSWVLDGRDVLRVGRIGHHLESREHLLIDLGGVGQSLRPRQLAFGLGLFTLLDGALGDRPPLVRLSDALTYHSPRRAGAAVSFVDEASRPGSRLFGQGAELLVESYAIRQEPARRATAGPLQADPHPDRRAS